jgi:hypothetical protein
LLLAVGLMVVLVAVLSIGLTSGVKTNVLNEGSRQFETMLRLTRAEAALQGRRFRINFTGEDGSFTVQWEPQPLAQPNQFDDYTARVWAQSIPVELVRVEQCRLTGDSAYRPLLLGERRSTASDSESAAFEPIYFYPDGSSDSALIDLRSTEEEDYRVAVVEIDGLNAMFSTRVLTTTEKDEFDAALEEQNAGN